MFGPEPPSIDMKILDTNYEELIFYLYAEYKDTCVCVCVGGGGGGWPNEPMFWVYKALTL
jgi:hypothetical protein